MTKLTLALSVDRFAALFNRLQAEIQDRLLRELRNGLDLPKLASEQRAEELDGLYAKLFSWGVMPPTSRELIDALGRVIHDLATGRIICQFARRCPEAEGGTLKRRRRVA